MASSGSWPIMTELAPVILVGLTYPGVAEQKQGPIYKLGRTRDYTPSHVENDGTGYGEEYQKFSGGGDRFLDFLTKELTPYLENGSSMPDRRVLP
jgi:predicted alpha/beta superfamily hydrolase